MKEYLDYDQKYPDLIVSLVQFFKNDSKGEKKICTQKEQSLLCTFFIIKIISKKNDLARLKVPHDRVFGLLRRF